MYQPFTPISRLKSARLSLSWLSRVLLLLLGRGHCCRAWTLRASVVSTQRRRTTAIMAASNKDDDIILVVGSCGLDRLLTVSEYPKPDDKIRTTSYCEVGGGNGSNSAHCMAALLSSTTKKSNPLGSPQFRIQLGTKVGTDTVAEAVEKELLQAGVDLSSPLFRINRDTTTAFTTILVTNDGKDPTRTCIHTPGSCGELSLEDIPEHKMEEIFRNVGHFHSDARHTDVALALARESKRRGIPISLDVEKDRATVALDQLLPLADMIFTNAGQMESYLERMHREYMDMNNFEPVPPLLVTTATDATTDNLDSEYVTHVLKPSMFFTRWYPEQSIAKQVIITKGSLGSIHVLCNDIQQKQALDQRTKNELTLAVDETDSFLVHATHEYTLPCNDDNEGSMKTVIAKYEITMCGISKDVDIPIVDTTGAGDAFLGAYLLLSKQPWASVHTCLQFAAWVAGRKLGGPGARTGLPTADQVQERLGENPEQVLSTLQSIVESWSPKVLHTTENAEPILS